MTSSQEILFLLGESDTITTKEQLEIACSKGGEFSFSIAALSFDVSDLEGKLLKSRSRSLRQLLATLTTNKETLKLLARDSDPEVARVAEIKLKRDRRFRDG